MEPNELGLLLPEPTARDSKYSRGTVGFVTGSDEYPGAALLGVAGAQATSVGFVRYVGPSRVADLLLISHPEVVVAEAFEISGPAQVWVLGSGVSFVREAGQSQRANLFDALGRVRAAVIDAGALDLIGEVPLASGSHHLLTPHQGEMCRLMNRLAPGRFLHPEMLDDPDTAVEITRRAAETTGHAVLLKGSVTRIAEPDGSYLEVGPNSALLATAGTGDVLAGVIGGIGAQNPEIAATSWLQIARLGVELHSQAAQIAAESGAVTAGKVASAVSQAISRRFQR